MNDIKLSAHALNLYFGNKQILKNVNIDFPKNQVTALIGPSGCGKSTLLRTFNRMHDLTADAKIEGRIKLDDVDIYEKRYSVTELRKRIGMVFQKPNPLPKSIYENLAYALNIHKFSKNEIPKESVKIEQRRRPRRVLSCSSNPRYLIKDEERFRLYCK